MRQLKLVKKVNDLIGIYKNEYGKYFKLDFSKDVVPFIPTDPVQEEEVKKYRLKSYSKEELEKIVKEKVEIEKEKIKKALEIKNDVDFENLFLYKNPVQLRSKVEREFEAFFLPHELNFYVDIYGRSGWSAKIYLENTIVDAWGMEEHEDSETVARGSLAGYLGNGEVAIEIPDVIIKPTYYNIDAKSTKILEEILDQYIEIDVNDIRGHLFGAWITVGLNDKSDDEEWNRLVKEIEKRLDQIRLKDRKRHNKEILAQYDSWIKENAEKIKELKIEKEINEIYRKVKNEAEKDRYLTDYELKEMKRLLEEKEKEKREIEYYKNLLKEMKNNEKPLFSASFKHGERVEIYAKNFKIKGKVAFIEIPKNLIGAFIGKRGVGIKTYKKVLGVKKIIINEANPIESQTKSIYRQDIPQHIINRI